ncbi:ECF transporter S component [Actinomyces culturomici]|uniref:ECF transporter S component n=1 Tax=Actinomyces culturomici TaxID=1926276 RepID=UPI000E1FE5A5|nr:ECF transporter S component [Actinomyces culturomici]
MGTTASNPRLGWRVVDMVTAAVLGVAVGVIFLVWDQVYGLTGGVLDALTPGLSGLLLGGWLLGGTLGGLVIRKPGAAILVEVIAASVESAVGSEWGITALFSGIIQGLGVEIVLAILLYRRFSPMIIALGGALSAAFEWVLELYMYGHIEKGPLFLTVYLVTCVISGAVLAGGLGWVLMRGLARTGALDRFAAGREVRSRV